MGEDSAPFKCEAVGGILRGDICCAKGCGECGGKGCAKRGNGGHECCTGAIEEAGLACSATGAAPCIVD